MSTDVQHTRTLSERVAEEIRVALARQRMSGRELARKLEVSPNWVSLRITGAQPIALNDLTRIAEALGVSVGDLLPREARSTTHEYSQAIDPLAPRIIRTIGENTPTLPTTRPVRQTRPTRPTVRPRTPATR